MQHRRGFRLREIIFTDELFLSDAALYFGAPMTNSFKTVLLTAMENAREGITVSDANLPDNPLIYVNKGFLKMTGYTAEEVLNKNCRFLQGAQTDQPNVSRLREAIRRREAVQVELLNFHKNGTPFYNRLSITPVFDEAGGLTHFIGIQEDVTALKQKEEAARKLAREHLVYTTTVQAQQEERESLGKELHDNINQVLATTRLLLTTKTETAEGQEALMRQSGELLNTAIEEIRRLSRRLVAPRFTQQGLVSEIQNLIDKLRPALTFAVHTQFNFCEEALPDHKKFALYRIAQEGIHNCVKYAAPTQVVLSLREQNNGVELLLKDDGAGFDPALTAEGIGLRNMRARAEAAGGRFAVKAAPGKGCSLCVWVPLT